MNISNLDLNLLRVFDAIYREQSLTKAATRLGCSQPAISQALNRLRESTGDPLFIRQSHGMTPTAYGNAIAVPIRQALENIQIALQAQNKLDLGQTDRCLRIAMSDYSQSLILPPLMRVIHEQAPNLQIRIIPDGHIDLSASLYDGEIDLVIGAIHSLDEYFRHQDLFSDDFVCIVRQGHPAIRGEVNLNQYAHAQHVNFTIRNTSVVQIACDSKGIQRHVSLILPNFLALPFTIAQTDYIATMPRRLMRLSPSYLNLQVLELPVELQPLIAAIRQYWGERHHRDTVCLWLREQILKVCQTL